MASNEIMNIIILFIVLSFAFAIYAHENEFHCTEKGRFIDPTDVNCKRYFLCNRKKNGHFVKSVYDCPAASNFDVTLGYCTSVALCNFNTTTTVTTTAIETTTTTTEIEPTTAIPSNNNYTCLSEGRFPDTDACDCGWFFVCKLYHTQLTSTRLYCPPRTKFDPTLSRCSENYKCDEEIVCTEKGIFPIQGDNTTYYNCDEMNDGSFLQSFHKCPNDMVFSLSEKHCILDHEEIPTTIEIDNTNKCETITTFMETSTGTVSSSHFFKCKSIGRFPDPVDQLCKSYYLCIDQQSFHYNCPNDMSFDPHEKECRFDYKCTGDSVTEKWTSLFHCQKRGYFKNIIDFSSKSYHFCDVLGDGKITQYELTCPTEYTFDEDTNLCKN